MFGGVLKFVSELSPFYQALTLGGSALVLSQWWRAIPGCWHARVTFGLIYDYFFTPPLKSLIDARINAGLSVTHYAMDWNFHMNNTIYFLDTDVVRIRYIGTLLGFQIGRSGNARKVWSNHYLALGGASFNFLKEMRFGQRYKIEHKIVGIDKKWIYMRTRFIDDSSKSKGTVFAVGMSRIVFKVKVGPEAGKTVPPAEFLFEKLKYERPASWVHEDKCTLGEFFDSLKDDGEKKDD